MAKILRVATVLYDVLQTVVPAGKVDNEVCFDCFQHPDMSS
jgi:hypothetical protein